MIVKNEAKTLPVCLNSVADLVDEIIVADTGSADETHDVARSFGGRVFELKWKDSFSVARNEAQRHATGDWIFWLDGDEHINEDNRQSLRSLFFSLRNETQAYVMKRRILGSATSSDPFYEEKIRLYRNHPEVRWNYRVHEQVLPALARIGAGLRWTDVVIEHPPEPDASSKRHKLEGYLRLLLLDQADNPTDPYCLFSLSWTAQELAHLRMQEAIAREPTSLWPRLVRSQVLLREGRNGDSTVKALREVVELQPSNVQAWRNLITLFRRFNQVDEALKCCRQALCRCPGDPDLEFFLGMLLHETKHFEQAETLLKSVIDKSSSNVTRERRCMARHHLAFVYRAEGQNALSEKEWRTIVSERRDFIPAWVGLGEIYLEQQRQRELDVVLDELAIYGHETMEAGIFRAQVFLMRQDFATARRELASIIARTPQAIEPRVLLSYSYLQEGSDRTAAENALLDVLALDPENAEAQHNLSVLRNNMKPPQRQAGDFWDLNGLQQPGPGAY